MENAGAEAGPAHACVVDSNHVPGAFLQQFFRNGNHAVFGHARSAFGPRIAQHQRRLRSCSGPFLTLAISPVSIRSGVIFSTVLTPINAMAAPYATSIDQSNAGDCRLVDNREAKGDRSTPVAWDEGHKRRDPVPTGRSWRTGATLVDRD